MDKEVLSMALSCAFHVRLYWSRLVSTLSTSDSFSDTGWSGPASDSNVFG